MFFRLLNELNLLQGDMDELSTAEAVVAVVVDMAEEVASISFVA